MLCQFDKNRFKSLQIPTELIHQLCKKSKITVKCYYSSLNVSKIHNVLDINFREKFELYDPPPQKKFTKISGVFKVKFCSICSYLGNTDTLKIHLYTNNLHLYVKHAITSLISYVGKNNA